MSTANIIGLIMLIPVAAFPVWFVLHYWDEFKHVFVISFLFGAATGYLFLAIALLAL